MRDKALEIARQADADQLRLNQLREYLQQVILREMFELDWLPELVFHEGTALRMLHDLRRFSEDLDFHLQQPVLDYSIESELKALRRKLELNGYDVDCSPVSSGNVRSTSAFWGRCRQ